MLSIETYKEQKETKKLQKITLKKEKIMSDNKKKRQLSSWAEMLRVKKATKVAIKTKPKKKKQMTRWKLVKMLDSIFSKYIRLSYANKQWLVQCITAKTKPKKKKQMTRWKLVKMLDSIFSKYIRLSYANKQWLVQCITSKKWYHRKEIQNWHFISRWNYKYRWDEKNCFPQSYVDNCILNGNYKQYTIEMIRMFWDIVVENMVYDKELVKISTPRIREQIEHYEECVKALLDTKWL